MTFGDLSYPVARKVYKCQHCLENIGIGERHRKFVGEWEGDFQSWRVHEVCATPLAECQDEFGALCDAKHAMGMSCKRKA